MTETTLPKVKTSRALAIEREKVRDKERLTQAAVRLIEEVRSKPMADLQLIGPSELGQLLGRSTMTIKVDSSRRPETLPPRFVVPGMRKMQWRIVDVKEWMEALAELEQDRRAAQVRYARELGIPASPKRFSMGDPVLGRAATERMFDKRQKGAA